ncbi:hypothetical protein HPP92_004567 [Vanilla planifolia]|uniref:Uncharacterized protein n=1 Tax=Vanilla planifolia TaxID=51239 RepID=A0A835S4N1_VANPL|nr:hypothetical protein HPP92_004567 [Vanilla planifolia]
MSAPQASLLCRPSHSLHFIPPLLPVSSYYCTTVQPSGQAVELSEDRATLAGMVGDVGSVEKAAAVEANTGFEGKRLPLLVFLVGLWDLVKRGFGRLTMLEWMSWWPFLQQEKKLERLIAEADANPSDAEKQASLLIELNNHSSILMIVFGMMDDGLKATNVLFKECVNWPIHGGRKLTLLLSKNS